MTVILTNKLRIHDIFHLDASRETNSRLLGNFHFCCCSNSHSGEIRSKTQFHLVMSLIKVLHCSDLSTFGQLFRIRGLKKFLNSSFSVLFFFQTCPPGEYCIDHSRALKNFCNCHSLICGGNLQVRVTAYLFYRFTT